MNSHIVIYWPFRLLALALLAPMVLVGWLGGEFIEGVKWAAGVMGVNLKDPEEPRMHRLGSKE